MKTGPKILLWDCETAPLLSANWGIWESNAVWVIQDFYMLCFAYKWLGDKTVRVLGQNDFQGYKSGSEDDSKLIKELHKLFCEADIIVAHNGDSFDQKIANARFMIHRLGPPSPYRQIDTKKVAKRYARFTSNKLDDLGKSLNLGQKLSTGGADLWRACMAGDAKAWAKMKRYNKQDVVLLEQLYVELSPWIINTPNFNLYSDMPDKCPNVACGSPNLKSNGWKLTSTRKYRQYQCKDCGHYCSAPKAEKTERPAYVG